MSDSPKVRQATVADAPALVGIYAPYVERTAISFEAVVPDVPEFERRIETALSSWQWLVAELDGRPVGFAYGGEHRKRTAYRHSVEVAVYVDGDRRGHGIGRALYSALLADLAARGYCNAYAGVVLPNDASLGLHRALGFEWIGVFKSIGWKFGRWHDVAWFQKSLRDRPLDAGE